MVFTPSRVLAFVALLGSALEVHARGDDGAQHGRAGSVDRRVFLFPPSAFGTPALMCVCVCRPDCTAWRPGVVVRFSVLGSASGPAPEGAVGACRHARTLPYCPAGGVPRVCDVATSVPLHEDPHAIRPTAARLLPHVRRLALLARLSAS